MCNNYKLRLILMHAIIFIAFIPPFVARCQLHRKFSIQVNIGDGTIIKATEVSLLDSTRKTILKKYCDSFGRCRFTGVNKGVYSLLNKKYKIDTTFIVPDTAILSYSPQRTIFDIDIDLNICDINAKTARKEVRKGNPRLISIGGLAPVYVFGQQKFENKFHIKYYDFGDSGPSESCALQYNLVVFAYLDKKYGKAWRNEVREDIIGLKKYISEH